MAHCNTVLSQILRIFPRHEFQALADKYHTGQKFRSFSRWTQFVALMTAQLTGRDSLRDNVENMSAQAGKLYHLGIKPFSRATLSRVNETQPHQKISGSSLLLVYLQSRNNFNQNSTDFSASFFMHSIILTELRLNRWLKYRKLCGIVVLPWG